VNLVHFVNVLHDSPARASYSRSARKREARADAILDEAMRVLAEDGPDGLTLARIGRALGCVPAALYRYFESKDALLAALQRRAIAEIRDALGLELARVDAEAKKRRWARERVPLAKLCAAARAYLALPQTHPEAYLLVAVLLGDPRKLLSDEESRVTAPQLLALLADVHALFEEAAAAGALAPGDAMERTLALWAALQGALSLEKARRVAPALPSAAHIGMVAALGMLTGWGAPPALLRRSERIA
jgi:AcrR family transcriptional regulator